MNTRKITLVSMLAALTAVVTWAVKMPLPNNLGYVHFGDSIIYLAAFLFGGPVAALSGAIGGAISDLLSGFAVYAIPTAIIKGLMGLLAGYVFSRVELKYLSFALAFIISGIVMVFGYYITEVIMVGNFLTPLSGVPFNFAQVAISIPVPCILYPFLKKVTK